MKYKYIIFEKLIMYFLQNGGDVNLKNSEGETAYDVNCRHTTGVAVNPVRIELIDDAQHEGCKWRI